MLPSKHSWWLACSLALAGGLAQAQSSAPPQPRAFDLVRAAEAVDARAAVAAGQAGHVAAWRARLDEQSTRTLASLVPLFDFGPRGWLDCRPARKALADALDQAASPAAVEIIVSMGVRTEDLHCHGQGVSGGWVAHLPAALDRARAGVPDSFVRTRALLAALEPIDWLTAARAATVPGSPGCMAAYMARARVAGGVFHPSARAGIMACAKARAAAGR